MKIQYLAVVLVMIIVPISIVMSGYIQNQIEAIEMQTKLDNNSESEIVKSLEQYSVEILQ